MKKIYSIVKIEAFTTYSELDDGHFSQKGAFSIIESHKSLKNARQATKLLNEQDNKNFYYFVTNSYKE